MSLSNTIKSIQDSMRKDVGIDGDAQQIGQLSWMLFYKIFSAQEVELIQSDRAYISPIPSELLWDSWAYSDWLDRIAIAGEDLLKLINSEVFPKLRNLQLDSFEGVALERGKLVQSVFQNAWNYMRSPSLIRKVIDLINTGIDYDQSRSRHLFGDIYEQILKDLQGAGKSGEFYTPRALTQFIVEIMNPQLGEKILDPACGTGGFLTCSYEHLKQQASTPGELELAKQSILGVEKKQLPHLLCVTNMLAHGIELPIGIQHGNALAKSLKEYKDRDRVDVIIANPPYGGTEEDDIATDFLPGYQARETADLFLILIIELLKKQGRAAVVLPDSILFGNNAKTNVKQRLLAQCNLHTIVRLPMGVFSPYTTIRTNILFFHKGSPTQEVWFYEHRCPANGKSYTKTKPLQLKDLEPLKEWWNDRQECDRAWKISIDAIAAKGYNLDIKNPHVCKEIGEDSTELLREYQKAIGEFNEAKQALREALTQILLKQQGKI